MTGADNLSEKNQTDSSDDKTEKPVGLLRLVFTPKTNRNNPSLETITDETKRGKTNTEKDSALAEYERENTEERKKGRAFYKNHSDFYIFAGLTLAAFVSAYLMLAPIKKYTQNMSAENMYIGCSSEQYNVITKTPLGNVLSHFDNTASAKKRVEVFVEGYMNVTGKVDTIDVQAGCGTYHLVTVPPRERWGAGRLVRQQYAKDYMKLNKDLNLKRAPKARLFFK